MKFREENNNITSTKLAKYKDSGYCVINALTNLMKANGMDTDLEKTQARVKYLVSGACNDIELFKGLMKDLHASDYKFDLSNKSDSFGMYNGEAFKKEYRRNPDCMNGNDASVAGLVLKNLGYKVKGIRRQLCDLDIENLNRLYGNFAMSLSGHMSCVANGEIIDFYNPFEKTIIHLDGSESVKPMRKNVEFIIYK